MRPARAAGGEEPEKSPGIHVPVLVREVLEGLAIKPGMRVVDATVGAGGHALAILERMRGRGRFLGLDQDAEILKHASATLAPYKRGVRLIHANFRDLGGALKKEKFPSVDALLLDLGVSSLQLDEAARGFSFRMQGPLDMRMDRQSGIPGAFHIVNQWPEEELSRCFFIFGEERRSRPIARAIVRQRASSPIETTDQLASLIAGVIGGRGRIHPATRVFQALRIAVNGELEALAAGLSQGAAALARGGRMAVISFHSGEDRIVKRFFKGGTPLLRPVTKKPLTAGEEESARNPRARSAKLRIAEKA